MILYLDTSSLVKLYVQEQGSEEVHALVSWAEVVTTSQVAYAEVRAAFAKKRRESGFTDEEYRRVLQDFERDWERYFAIETSETVVRLAGELAEKHSLKGVNAIHLASAIVFKGRLASPVTFSSADQQLEKTAQHEGLDTPHSLSKG